MSSQCSPSRFSEARHDVDHSVGESRIAYQLTQPQRRKRRLFSRLEHHRTTRRQGRTEFPRRHKQGKIPWDDLPHHADRLASGIYMELRLGHVGDRDRDGRTFNFRGPSGHVAEKVHGKRHVSNARHREGLAVIECLKLSEFLEMLFQEVSQLPYEPTTVRRLHTWPGATFKSLTRSFDGLVYVFPVAFGHTRHHFACGWVHHVECTPACCIHPPPANEHLPWACQKRPHTL